jgi:hypothetical protein
MFTKQQSAKRFQKRVLELGFEILLVYDSLFEENYFQKLKYATDEDKKWVSIFRGWNTL